jgi:tRNA-Thr(GGU) m(6)t(6)A37 methyltransferase TsaA
MQTSADSYPVHPVGVVHSWLTERSDAPKQGYEGAPDAWIEIAPAYSPGLEGIEPGTEMIVLTWLNQSNREVLRVHPRGNPSNPITGVFATRSPDRPDPIGLHRVTIRAVDGLRLMVGPLEAIDGTPVVDLKPVLANSADW